MVGEGLIRLASVRETGRAEPAVRPAPWLVAGIAVGVSVAGFWNVRFVDGLGVATFVSPAIGAFEGKASQFASLGSWFGVLFAVVAGLAATITASSVATFTLLPLLAIAGTRSGSRRTALPALRVPVIMAAVVALVGALYGALVGRMGPEGAIAFNAQPIRGAQSLVVFSSLGIAMLLWAAIEAGLLSGMEKRTSRATRAFFGQSAVKAVVAGIIVGAFTIGRPLAVFREFLVYAAQPASVPYGSAVMATQSLATIAVPVALLVCALAFGAARLDAWMRARPRQSALVSASVMGAGGAFLLFYWGITRFWPGLGRWGFQLGIYQ
jgi:hypothetical protein